MTKVNVVRHYVPLFLFFIRFKRIQFWLIEHSGRFEPVKTQLSGRHIDMIEFTLLNTAIGGFFTIARRDRHHNAVFESLSHTPTRSLRTVLYSLLCPVSYNW
jgi:hypothetical protein